MMSLKELIEQTPTILQLFIPGFIFLKVFYFFTTDPQNDISLFTICSVVVSFIIISFVKAVDEIISQLNCSFWTVTIISILLAIIFAIIASKIYMHKWLNRLIKQVNNKSIHKSLWNDILDYDLGTTVKVFLKDTGVLYIGSLIEHEENGNDSWIVLSEYLSCNPTTEKIIYNSTADTQVTTVAINLSDVNRIELFYDSNTKIFE